jgi:hypothetical protein
MNNVIQITDDLNLQYCQVIAMSILTLIQTCFGKVQLL